MKKIVEGIVIGLLLGAIGASAKSILDVQSLKADNMTQIKNILIERL